jgi:4-amino-4-deoxy-L-arabinose transferase-like glycosyltransferase
LPSIIEHPLPVIVAGYVVLAFAFVWLVPPFEAPDETGHLFYIDFVARHLALPNQYDSARSVEGEGHQFPLYYVLMAPLVRESLGDDSVDLRPRVNRDASGSPPTGARPKFIHVGPDIFVASDDEAMFYALRVLSVALGAATVVTAWFVAGELVASRDQRILATALVATLPQFLFISASINNDNLANLLIALATLFMLHFSRSPAAGNASLLGLTLGLALCAKKSALFLVPAFAIVAGWLLVREAGRRREVLGATALAAAIALGLSGWVFVHQRVVYGDFLGSAMERRTLPALVDRKGLIDPYWVHPFAPWMGKSFVAVFGWMDVQLPRVAYAAYLTLGVAAVVGLLAGYPTWRSNRRIWIGFLLIVACASGVVVYNLTYTQYQGRFLFPVLPVIAALASRGLAGALRHTPIQRSTRPVALMLVLMLIAVDVVSLVVVYTFYSPRSAYI